MRPRSSQSRIAENLRYFRTIFGYTQSDAAQALHVCRCTYVQYEAGRKLPPTETLLALSRFYNISVDMLLKTDRCLLSGSLIRADRTDTEPSRLLPLFRRLTEAQQRALLRMAEALISQERAGP